MRKGGNPIPRSLTAVGLTIVSVRCMTTNSGGSSPETMHSRIHKGFGGRQLAGNYAFPHPQGVRGAAARRKPCIPASTRGSGGGGSSETMHSRIHKGFGREAAARRKLCIPASTRGSGGISSPETMHSRIPKGFGGRRQLAPRWGAGAMPRHKKPLPLWGRGWGGGQHDAGSQGIALGECIVPQGSQKGRHNAVLF